MQQPFSPHTPSSPAAVVGMIVLLFLVVVGLGVGSAYAGLRYTTSYRQNEIRGTTPEQLRLFMASHPIIDEDGPALANITHEHKLSVATVRSDGVCRVSNLDFKWDFVITLPKAVDEAGMSQKTRVMWREFTAYLKRHEERHRTIFLGCGKDFVAEAAKLTARGPCLLLRTKVKRYIDKEYQACMVKQRAFDREERRSVLKLSLLRTNRK